MGSILDGRSFHPYRTSSFPNKSVYPSPQEAKFKTTKLLSLVTPDHLDFLKGSFIFQFLQSSVSNVIEWTNK